MNLKEYTGHITQIMAGDSGVYFYIDALGGYACAERTDPLYTERQNVLLAAAVNGFQVRVWVDGDDGSTGADAWPLRAQTYVDLNS